MNPTDNTFRNALSTLLVEIFDGPPGTEAYLLNPGDPGLLPQLDTIDAKAASTRPMAGKTTIAAHVDHVCYGIELLNRWAAGEENPWATSDWSASWKRTEVNEAQWKALREKIRSEVKKWQEAVGKRNDWDHISAAGALASAAHTAYHLGSIRQILSGQGLYVGK